METNLWTINWAGYSIRTKPSWYGSFDYDEFEHGYIVVPSTDWRSDAYKLLATVFPRRTSDPCQQLLSLMCRCASMHISVNLSTSVGKRNLCWSPDTGNCWLKIFVRRPSFPYYYNYLNHCSNILFHYYLVVASTRIQNDEIHTTIEISIELFLSL